MQNNFKISGLSIEEFSHFFDMTQEDLQIRNVQKILVEEKPGYPCRVSLEDAEVGETVFLLPYVHHSVSSPYYSSGPIFVRESAKLTTLAYNEIPKMLAARILSVRAYNAAGMMVVADVTEGTNLKKQIDVMFEDKEVKYLHVHNARYGCFLCYVHRV